MFATTYGTLCEPTSKTTPHVLLNIGLVFTMNDECHRLYSLLHAPRWAHSPGHSEAGQATGCHQRFVLRLAPQGTRRSTCFLAYVRMTSFHVGLTRQHLHINVFFNAYTIYWFSQRKNRSPGQKLSLLKGSNFTL